MQPCQLADVADLRVTRLRTLKQADDLRGFALHLVLLRLRGAVEAGEQGFVAGSAVGESGFSVHHIAKALVLRQPPEVHAFEPDADEPQAGIDQCAEQAESGDAEPVRRHGHAQRPGIECLPPVVWLVLHVEAVAMSRNAGGTKLRSVASRMAMRIWKSR